MISSARIKVILTTNVIPPEVRIWFDNTRTSCLQGMWQRLKKHLSILGTKLFVVHTIMAQPVIFVLAFSFPPPPKVLFLQRKKLSSFVRTHFPKRPADENVPFRSRKLKTTCVISNAELGQLLKGIPPSLSQWCVNCYPRGSCEPKWTNALCLRTTNSSVVHCLKS